MPTLTYVVVFQGQPLEGFPLFSVKAHLAKLLGADADRMAKLFSGKPVVLKRTPDKAIALKYGAALKKVGADVRIKVIQEAEATAAPGPASPQQAATGPAVPTAAAARPGAKPAGAPAIAATAKSATAASATAATATAGKAPAAKAAASPGSTLAVLPNKGNLFDPKPPVKAPPIDTSGLSAVANWKDNLEPPREVPELALNLEGYALAPPGEKLVEPAPAVPKVKAPDFGLDAPGARLETIKPKVVELHPDISGLSLAKPGSTLLAADERPPPPPPVKPDLSKLRLVPNFDR